MIPFLQQFTGDRDDKELLANFGPVPGNSCVGSARMLGVAEGRAWLANLCERSYTGIPRRVRPTS